MDERIDRFVLRNLPSRNCTQIVIILPISRRTNRPWSEAATTIRTYVSDYIVNASGAKGALECADTRFDRIGWERLVAVFARGAEGECFNDIKLLVGEVVLSPDFFF